MNGRGYDVPAVRRAIALIELLCESNLPLGVSEISEKLEINKNMVFRLVRTLTEMGWVEPDHQDNLKYRMTLQPYQHASKPVTRMDIRTATEKFLRQLWQETQTSCYLCILDGRRALCIEHINATGALLVAGRVGGHYYLHSTAPGKILLAHAEKGLLERLDESDLPSTTSRTLCDKAILAEHLEEVRQQGYATDVMENADGVICYAVPIYNYEDRVVGSLGLTTLTFHYSVKSLIAELGPLVDRAGREASKTLGASEQVMNRYASCESMLSQTN